MSPPTTTAPTGTSGGKPLEHQNDVDLVHVQQATSDSIILEEEIDPYYVPTQDEVREYAKWLGMDLDKDRDLFWIAKEGLKAPLPDDWKPCKTKDTEEIYYFNFATGESTWDHPCDDYYRKLYEEEKKRKLTEDKAKNDKSKQQAKKDVDELLGKDRKKKKTWPSIISGEDAPDPPPANLGQAMPPPKSSIFDRKPLPGIGKQPLPDLGRLTCASSPLAHSDSSVASREGSPTRIKPPSLVGQRLSSHLSASAGSEQKESSPEALEPNVGWTSCLGDMHPTDHSIREQQERVDAMVLELELDLGKVKATHATDIQELHVKHDKEMMWLKDGHRKQIAHEEGKFAAELECRKKEWETALEDEGRMAEVHAQKVLEQSREEMLAQHEIQIQETKEKLQKEVGAKADYFKEAAEMERGKLEVDLADLRLSLRAEREALEQMQEQSQKVQAASCNRGGEYSKLEFLEMEQELKELRGRNSQLESELKQARSDTFASQGGLTNSSSDMMELPQKMVALEASLKEVLEENLRLKKEATATISSAAERRLSDVCSVPNISESKFNEKVQRLTKALEELEMELNMEKTKVVEIKRERNNAFQRADEATSAALTSKAKVKELEEENNQLTNKISKIHHQAEGRGNTPVESTTTKAELTLARLEASDLMTQLKKTKERLHLVETETAGMVLEKQRLQVELSEKEDNVVQFTSKCAVSEEQIKVLEEKLHNEELTLHQAQLKISDLDGQLSAAVQRESLEVNTQEQLRQEIVHLGGKLQEAFANKTEQSVEGLATREAELMLDRTMLRSKLATAVQERENLETQLTSLKEDLCCAKAEVEREHNILLAKESSHQLSMQEERRAAESEIDTLKEQVSSLIQKQGSMLQSIQAQQKYHQEGNSIGIKEIQDAREERDHAVCEAKESASRLHKAEDLLRLSKDQVTALERQLVATTSKLNKEQEVTNTSTQSKSQELVEELDLTHHAVEHVTPSFKEAGAELIGAETRLDQVCKEHTMDAEEERVKLEIELKDTKATLEATLKELSDVTAECTALKTYIVELEIQSSAFQERFDLAKSQLSEREKMTEGLQHKITELTSEVKNATNSVKEHLQKEISLEAQVSLSTEKEQALQSDLDITRTKLQDALWSAQQSQANLENATARFLEMERGLQCEKEDLAHRLQDALTLRQEEGVERMGGENNDDAELVREGLVAEGTLEHHLELKASSVKSTSPAQDVGQSELHHECEDGSTADELDISNTSLAEVLLLKLQERSCSKLTPEIKNTKYWSEKLEAERHILTLARRVVKHQKDRVKNRQKMMSACQKQWRNQRQELRSLGKDFKPRRSVCLHSLEDAKEILDVEVYGLNRLVGQLRKSRRWLDDREKKITRLEDLLKSSGSIKVGSCEQEEVSTSSISPQPHPSTSSGSSISLRVHELEQIQNELDKDLSSFTVDSNTSDSAPSHHRRVPKLLDSKQKEKEKEKENTSPETIQSLGFAGGYPPYFPFHAGMGCWAPYGHPFCAAVTASTRMQAMAPVSHGPGPSSLDGGSHRLDGYYGTFPSTHAFDHFHKAEGMEERLAQWVATPAFHLKKNGHRNDGAKERREQLSKWTLQRQHAHTTVATHVDWLKSLKNEMTMLGWQGEGVRHREGDSNERGRPLTAVGPREVSSVTEALLSSDKAQKAN